MIENFSFKATIDDGVIQIEQRDLERTQVICLAPSQLRAIAEHFGLVPPQHPADELTKRLARQLCEIRRDFADECNCSPSLELTWEKLHGFCQSIPDSVFPYELFEDQSTEKEPTQQIAPAGKSSPMASTTTEFSLQHSN